MGTSFKIASIVTLVIVGIQLIALRIADGTTSSGTFPHSHYHSATATSSKIASNAVQKLADTNLSNGYEPPDNGGPGQSQGSGTR